MLTQQVDLINNALKKPVLRVRTDGAWFSRLLGHLARKWRGLFLQPQSPQWGSRNSSISSRRNTAWMTHRIHNSLMITISKTDNNHNPYLERVGRDPDLCGLPACVCGAARELWPRGPVDADRLRLLCSCGCRSNVGKPPSSTSLPLATERCMSLRRSSAREKSAETQKQARWRWSTQSNQSHSKWLKTHNILHRRQPRTFKYMFLSFCQPWLSLECFDSVGWATGSTSS